MHMYICMLKQTIKSRQTGDCGSNPTVGLSRLNEIFFMLVSHNQFYLELCFINKSILINLKISIDPTLLHKDRIFRIKYVDNIKL